MTVGFSPIRLSRAIDAVNDTVIYIYITDSEFFVNIEKYIININTPEICRTPQLYSFNRNSYR